MPLEIIHPYHRD